jgi:hypothetical protein
MKSVGDDGEILTRITMPPSGALIYRVGIQDRATRDVENDIPGSASGILRNSWPTRL